MVNFLLELPLELREPILRYCSHKELHNLARSCKAYYHMLADYLWRELHISWSNIGKKCFIPNNCAKPMGMNTEALYFNFCTSSSYSAYESTKDWGKVVGNYRKILSFCSVDRLIKLDVRHLLNDEGLQLACGILKKLENVTLCSLEISNIGWLHLSQLKKMRKLTVNSCSLQNHGLRMISQSKTLEELVIDECNYVNDGCFEYIGNMRNLKRLSIINTNGLFLSDNLDMYCESLQHLDNSTKLVFLSFQGTLLKKTVVSALCTCNFMRHLEIINVQKCNLLCQRGISELKNFGINNNSKLTILS